MTTADVASAYEKRLPLAKDAYGRVIDAQRQLEDRVNRLFTGVAFITTGALAFGLQTELFTIRYTVGDGGLPLPAYAFLGFFLWVILGVLLLLAALAPAPTRYSGPPGSVPASGRVDFLDIADADPLRWSETWTQPDQVEFLKRLLDGYVLETHRIATRAEYKHARINEARGAFTVAFTSLFLAIALTGNALARLRVPNNGLGSDISLSSVGRVPWDHWAIAIVVLTSTLFASLVGYERYRNNQSLDALSSNKYWTSWRRYRRVWLIAPGAAMFQIGVLGTAFATPVRLVFCILGAAAAEAALWQKHHTGWEYMLIGIGITFVISAAIVVWFGDEQLQLLVAMLVIVALELPRILYSTVRWQGVRRTLPRRSSGDRPPNPWLTRRVLNIAHQGGAKEAPSNTIYAIKCAQQAGADAVDVDVHATGDETVVALHDPTLDRTTDRSGRVRLLSGSEVTQRDAAYWWVPGKVDDHDSPNESYSLRGACAADETLRVPKLSAVLGAVSDEYVTIEIKDHVAVEATVAAVREFGKVNRVLFNSFSDGIVRHIRKNHPDLNIGPGRLGIGWFLLRSRFNRPPKTSRYAALALPDRYDLVLGPLRANLYTLNERVIEHAHGAGLAVHVWTIDSEKDMQRLISWGVDGIYTDRPSVLTDVLAELRRAET